ncbi:hypothetical protein [Fulvimarina sp. MAC8]|uniref:hypothetical protein n=1 Tax=Fulvimarina sp. MAC8 TaxID=3162874 RepID=UPI0032EE69D5
MHAGSIPAEASINLFQTFADMNAGLRESVRLLLEQASNALAPGNLPDLDHVWSKSMDRRRIGAYHRFRIWPWEIDRDAQRIR